MSYADVVTQMQAIQTQLAQLGLLKTSTASGSSTSAASFATALDSASTTSTGTTGAASTAGAAATDGALVSSNGATGNDVVSAALDYTGVPYVLGGESKSGIDCSGLVQAAFGTLGVSVPRTVHEQKVIGEKVDSLKDAKPGDLIVLNGGDHIAVYTGNDTVIHAPYPGRTVSVQKVWFTDSDITTIRRIVPATDDTTAAASTTSTAASDTSTAPSTSSSGLSAATMLKATAMLTTSGADVGLYSASSGATDDSSSGGTSLSSLLASFGLSGTASTSTSASSTSAQQIIAARTALLGATA